MFYWNLKSRSLRPIGLDIGHHSIKMIQLAINDNQISVCAADKVCIDADINGDGEERRRFIISAINKMLSRGGFRGREVVSCLPNDKLKITSLRLAEAESAEIEQALAKEAVHRFGLDPDKDTINYLNAGTVRQGDEIKNELILFAADDETIRNHIAMLEEAQLKPVAIDAVPCALFRSFERNLRRQEDKERTVVFVDIGSQFTTVVFGRAGEICFVKKIPFGGDRFNQEIGAKLGIDINEVQILRAKFRMERGLSSPWSNATEYSSADDGQRLDASTEQVMIDAINSVAHELAREISLCFRYYTVTFRGKFVDKAIFSGGETYENILLDALRGQLKIEIEAAQPLRGFDIKHARFDCSMQDLNCEWAVAVGLSLKGWKWSGENGSDKQALSVERRVFSKSDNNERD